MEEKYERFEITDYDLDNEFNPNRPRRKLSKKQQIYGVFGDDSDDDEEEVEKSSRKNIKGGKSKDFSAPIGFVSGGIEGGKKKEDKKKSDEDPEQEPHRGFGFAGKNSSDSEEEVRPSFKPVESETAGIRSFKGGMKNKGLGEWEQHTRGIGAKLLLQMGFQIGKGLGKNHQGISAPVEVHLRKGRGAIGAYGPEKKSKIAELKSSAKKEEPKVESKGKQWSKKAHKSRYFYKSVEDVLEKGKKPDYVLYDTRCNKPAKSAVIIDMTGPEKRVLSGYHALGQMKISEDDVGEKPDLKQFFQLPELMHNLNIIVNMCEQEIIANDKRQRTAEDKQQSMMGEKEQLEKIVGLEKKYIETLEDVEEFVQRLTNTDHQPSLDEAEQIFRELKLTFPNEYKEFGLSDLAPGVIAPILNATMKNWNPLEDPTKYVNVIKNWAVLLDYSVNHPTTVFEPYPALVWSTVIPCFRKASAEWNPKYHAKMAALLDAWSSLLPEWMLDNVLDQIVLNRITQAVAEWDPMTDIVPIHTWILPWSKILDAKMHENVYKTIRNNLSKAFRAWHPSDRSALAMIKPWKSVFKDEDLAIFLYKNVVPKLEFRMSEIVFNPLQQDLEIFNQIWEWNDLLSPLVMANILDKYFFPKWMQTLVLWLNQSPNFDEVSRWYTGWKGLFTESVLKQSSISEHFRRALELMQRATGINLPMPEPISQPSQPTNIKIIPLSNVNLEYREIVSQKCAERGIIFAPISGRRESGKQVYRIGKLFCYFEKSVCCVTSDPANSQTYMPMSLNVILEKAK